MGRTKQQQQLCDVNICWFYHFQMHSFLKQVQPLTQHWYLFLCSNIGQQTNVSHTRRHTHSKKWPHLIKTNSKNVFLAISLRQTSCLSGSCRCFLAKLSRPTVFFFHRPRRAEISILSVCRSHKVSPRKNPEFCLFQKNTQHCTWSCIWNLSESGTQSKLQWVSD